MDYCLKDQTTAITDHYWKPYSPSLLCGASLRFSDDNFTCTSISALNISILRLRQRGIRIDVCIPPTKLYHGFINRGRSTYIFFGRQCHRPTFKLCWRTELFECCLQRRITDQWKSNLLHQHRIVKDVRLFGKM